MIKNGILYEPFSNWRFHLAKAKDGILWDAERKRYVDFTSGWNVCNLGWNNEEIAEAVAQQAKSNTYTPMWASDDIRNKYASLLLSTLPKELSVIARATGGTEANEEALKTVKAFTGRKKILCFKKSYHGQSRSTQALGFIPSDTNSTDAVLSEVIQIEFPAASASEADNALLLAQFSDQLEKILADKEVAAIMTEAGIITGWGWPRIAPAGFLKLVREKTKKYGTLMILDEVGTGFSRCGFLFGMQEESVVPDIATFAKAQTNGAGVLGTMVTTQEIAEKTMDKTSLISTFGWTPLSCAAAYSTLTIHLREKIWEKAATDGIRIVQKLQQELEGCSLVESVSGKGMIIGIRLEKPVSDKIVETAWDKGLHIVGDGQQIIQLMPPLVLSTAIIDEGLGILVEAIKSLA